MTAEAAPVGNGRSRDAHTREDARSIEEVEARLRAWVSGVDPSAEITFGPPEVSRPGLGASFDLVGIAPRLPPRGLARAPVRISLRYLLTTWSDQLLRAHQLLVELALDALEHGALDLDFDGRSAESWNAPHVPSRPALLVLVPVSRVRTELPTARVRHPLVLRPARGRPVAGRVVGPDDTPIPDATVGIVGLALATRTDRLGRFALSSVPELPVPTRLRVVTKGLKVVVPVPEDTEQADAMLIRLAELEMGHGLSHS